MRVLTLHILAICQLASSTPCKPALSSESLSLSTASAEYTALPTSSLQSTTLSITFVESTIVSTVASSTDTEETESSTIFLSGSSAVSETEIATSETEAEATSMSTTSFASEIATSTTLLTTSSAVPTTATTAEDTTTTTSIAEPTNVLVNPGFESASLSPWHSLNQFGTVSLADSDAHSGVYSGHFAAEFRGPVVLGVDHPIDPDLIKVDQEYTFSIWIKTTVAVNCLTRWTNCGSGGGFIKHQEWASPYNEWTQFSMSCTWNQMFHDMGPSIQIRGECQSLEFYVDDAVVIEAN
ncbi:hypothetical protein ACLX1H_008190 [Fusarium chlamydosporum]